MDVKMAILALTETLDLSHIQLAFSNSFHTSLFSIFNCFQT